MSDFVKEKSTLPGIDEDKQEDSLLKLLALPYPTLSEKLKRAALDLKETVIPTPLLCHYLCIFLVR